MDEIDNNNGELFRYFGDSAALSSRVETESHLACWAVWVVGSLWPETRGTIRAIINIKPC